MTVSVLKYNNKIIAQNKSILTLTEVDWIPSMIPGCILWLEPSNIQQTDGYVYSWLDQSGNNNHATQSDDSRKPYYIPDGLNGYPTVHPDLGYGTLNYTYPLSNIRTVFLVLKHNTGTQGYPPILGSTINYDFDGGLGTALFSITWTSPNIKNGNLHQNGSPISVYTATKPINFVTLSIITTGNVRSNRLTGDRNLYGRSWDGEYAEIILYDVPITSTERIQVENYLNAKYQIY